MSADKVRRLLGSLLDDPENEKAWISLEERAISGELLELGEELPFMLAESRLMFAERGEAEAVLRVLDVEVELTPDVTAKVRLLRERARVSEEELLDDRTALASVEALVGLGGQADAAELKDRLTSKKARWKEILAAYKRHAENDTTDPALIASHLASAAGIVFQYKGKGRDREADQLFESALSVDPGNVRAVHLYERVLRKRGDRWADLAALLERSAEFVTATDVRVNLLLRAARTHAGRLRQFGDAERLYRKVLTLDTGHVDATRFLAALLTEQGRVDDLIDFYEGQLRASPANARDVGLLALTGMAHWRMRHDPRAADGHFRKILELAPDNPIAQSFFFEHQSTVVEMSPLMEDAIGDDVEFDTSGMEEFSVEVDDGDAGATVEMPAAGITLDMLRAAQPAASASSSGAVRIVRTHVLGGGGEPARSMAPTPQAAPAAPVEAPADDNATVVEAPAASSAMLAALLQKSDEAAAGAPKPAVVEAPKPAVAEAPKPAVAEAPEPAAVEAPKPAAVEAPPIRSAVETTPLVEPTVPAEYERVTASNVTVAWPAGVKVLEPTSLGYTIAGLLEEAAIATGTEPRERLTVFLHGSRDDLHLATGTPEWATGVYDGALHLVAEPSTDFGVRISTMRHEVMHAQLHAGVGCMPAWFNEGAAQYFAGRPPLQTWMTMLKEREAFDFDALAAPTIVEAPKEDASKLYAQSLAMVLFELDRSKGGLQAVVASLHEIDASDPGRRARLLWKTLNPGVGPGDLRSALAQRIFGVSSERELDGVFDQRVCCSGGRRIDDLSCRAAPAGSEAVTSDERCRRY